MGNVLVPVVLPAIITTAANVLPRILGRPDNKNPTLVSIEALHRAEEAQRRAEEAARQAEQFAEQIRQKADEDRERALLCQREADRVAEEVKWLKVQVEEAANVKRRAEEATRMTREDAERTVQKAHEELEHALKMRDDAQRAREEAMRTQQDADKRRHEAEVGRAHAEELARAAAEEARKANAAKQEAEERLKSGVQPKITPTPEELAAVKKRVQYREDRFHFAIAGTSGSGKSSLVNAFRGVRTRDAGAAAVGATETTLEMTRYEDVNWESPFVWYDVPGAGTLKCPDWQYFHDQGLYVFDCIIVLFDNRFTMTDVAILTSARRFNIPTYIVRSKADQHIQNIVMEMNCDSDDEDEEHQSKLEATARKQFIDETRKSVKENLRNANLADQRVYIVSKNALLSIVSNKMPKNTIDEVDLISDLVNTAYNRRVITQKDGEVLVV